ncbi:MAG: InlB B-repeat-containing protein [Clostridia bacterium]|nr:InlB B-repeat-containing protein [Clostridia bacterium]
MKLNRIFLFILLIVSIMLFAACGGNADTDTDTDTAAGVAPKSYKITFTVDGNLYTVAFVTEGQDWTMPSDPEKANTEFAGWFTDAELKTPFNKDTAINSDMTVYAKFDYKCITIKEALEMNIADGQVTEERYYIRATIDSIANAQYGSMYISDSTGTIYVYGSYSNDGELLYSEMESVPYRGDEVLIYGTLKNFQGTIEVNSGWIIEFISKAEDFDSANYTDMSIEDARKADKDTLIKVDGVVAKVLYAFGMKPCGFYLVDETSSIYVYDADTAQRVKEGNKVTVCARKDYWILDTEQNSAQKFGYQGCCQLAEANLIDNDNGNHDFDKSWITESTVKEMMDTPFDGENITTKLFKVNALIKKTPGSGFVNYYINDIDGVTGTYTYTQCNGSDFAWLDEFDGKICTVYLSCINAKSSAAGCLWRFMPVAVIDENYTFDKSDAPKFGVDYFGVPSFESSYMLNASVELPTSVSSELLGIEGVVLSYTVSDDTVASIVTEDGKTYFKALSAGEVTVTVKGSYQGAEDYEKTVKITVNNQVEYESITVGAAINTASGTEVTVKGIVGPSAVNQKGTFYLISEDGAIPVRGTNEIMSGLSIGDEVVVKGTRTVTKDGGGQIVIDNAVILANYYGDNEYSTNSFISDKTIADIAGVEDSVEATTNVYTVTAKVEKVSATQGSYTNVTFYVGSVLLYSGSASQYSWLEAFFAEGELSAELTVELALCDWNAKGLKGCVLAVITDDGKVYNTTNFN